MIAVEGIVNDRAWFRHDKSNRELGKAFTATDEKVAKQAKHLGRTRKFCKWP